MTIIMSCSSLSEKTHPLPDRTMIFPAALKGDLSEIINSFVETSDQLLNQEQLELKDKYISRFLMGTEKVDPYLNDFVAEVITAYQTYWRKSLLQKLSIEEGTEFLYGKLKTIAEKKGEKFSSYNEEEAKRLVEYLRQELNTQGYKSLFGRTKPYLDLMLWKKESLEQYSINLGDEMIKVDVVMIDDFVVYGWLGFATFDQQKTGGWATKEKLFCVKSAYDKSSEQFLVSYLAHEGRHFSDYKKFPMLQSADLEYRAKLTEISLAETTLRKLLERFYNERANNHSSAHAYASFHLIKELSLKLEVEVNPSTIIKINPTKIRAAATELIAEHTLKLNKIGSDKTKGLFLE